MDGSGLELIGSRPPSRLDSRPPASVRSTHRTYTDRHDTSRFQSHSQRSDNGDSHQDNDLYRSENCSFGVTRTLFRPTPGGDTADNNWRTRTFTADRPRVESSDLRNAGILSDRPSSRQPSSRADISYRPPSGCITSKSARTGGSAKRNFRPIKHGTTYIDETLFGAMPQEAGFAAPWENQAASKPFTFDCTDYRNRAVTSRPSSARPPSSARKYRSSHQPGYVDNTLFGDHLEPTSWRAPWEKPTEKIRPLLFDSNDYRLTVQHDNIETVNEFRGRTRNLVRAGSVGNLAKKPAPWR